MRRERGPKQNASSNGTRRFSRSIGRKSSRTKSAWFASFWCCTATWRSARSSCAKMPIFLLACFRQRGSEARAMPERAAILAYHRVGTRPHDFFGLGVERERFVACMQLLAQRFEPVSLENIGRTGNVAVTFDDGYASNLEISEILIDLRIPATYFVNSGVLDSREERFWDRLERIFFEQASIPRRLDLEV